jgi:hypothetical protein
VWISATLKSGVTRWSSIIGILWFAASNGDKWQSYEPNFWPNAEKQQLDAVMLRVILIDPKSLKVLCQVGMEWSWPWLTPEIQWLRRSVSLLKFGSNPHLLDQRLSISCWNPYVWVVISRHDWITLD